MEMPVLPSLPVRCPSAHHSACLCAQEEHGRVTAERAAAARPEAAQASEHRLSPGRQDGGDGADAAERGRPACLATNTQNH